MGPFTNDGCTSPLAAIYQLIEAQGVVRSRNR
jgi:hypothetical protein